MYIHKTIFIRLISSRILHRLGDWQTRVPEGASDAPANCTTRDYHDHLNMPLLCGARSTYLTSLIQVFSGKPYTQECHISTVKGVFMVSKPCDLLRHRRSLPPNRAGTESGASVYAHITLVRQTNFPPNENAGGRNDDYIWLPSEFAAEHSCYEGRWIGTWALNAFPPNEISAKQIRCVSI